MSDKVTLEQLEQLVAHLAPPEQIRLIARISERLSGMSVSEATAEQWRQDYAARIEAVLKMCEEKAAETIGEVDSATDYSDRSK